MERSRRRYKESYEYLRTAAREVAELQFMFTSTMSKKGCTHQVIDSSAVAKPRPPSYSMDFDKLPEKTSPQLLTSPKKGRKDNEN